MLDYRDITMLYFEKVFYSCFFGEFRKNDKNNWRKKE